MEDPCAALGSRARLEAALSEAGFGRAEVEAEHKTRVYPAASPREYAERMFEQSAGNPLFPLSAAGLPPPAAAALRDEAVRAIEASASARFEAGAGVASPYTVLHVLAAP
jgi:hypothetical protein